MRIDLPLAAHASPFDSGITSIQTLFTGTIAKAASLIAIVIGGYTFAHGEPGAKKTTLIMQILRQIQGRSHSAIVYDPACEFIQRFYDAKRGDIVLNPLDARCPYWGPSEELRRKAEAKAIAASLYQPTSDKKGEFFTETPQKIFAHLLTFGPTPGGVGRMAFQPG